MTHATDSLHQQIMNLRPEGAWATGLNDHGRSAYKVGHRDARHAAAELSLAHGAAAAAPAKALRMPSEADLMQAQMQSGADDLDRCKQAISIFCGMNGLDVVIDGEGVQADSYDALWNALQRVHTVAAFLPTLEVRHEGGIEATTKNIVEAIAAAGEKLAALEHAKKRERILVQALKGLADEFVKVYPIYYYAEPWAHNRNLALRFAKAVVEDVGPAVGAVPERARVADLLRGAGLDPQVAQETAQKLMHYFATGENFQIEAEVEKA